MVTIFQQQYITQALSMSAVVGQLFPLSGYFKSIGQDVDQFLETSLDLCLLNVVKCNLSQVKHETMLVSGLPLSWSCAVARGLLGVVWFYSSAFEVNSFSRAILPV